jgi:hypothetical protein
MARELLLKAVLVPEASDAGQKEIEDEIRREFGKGLIIIPWCQNIKAIKVVE